jgi:hypothetical protein
MTREIDRIVTEDVIPVLRATLKETTELRGAVQVLADRVDRLTGELAEGELLELTKLAARVVRVFETSHTNGGGRR